MARWSLPYPTQDLRRYLRYEAEKVQILHRSRTSRPYRPMIFKILDTHIHRRFMYIDPPAVAEIENGFAHGVGVRSRVPSPFFLRFPVGFVVGNLISLSTGSVGSFCTITNLNTNRLARKYPKCRVLMLYIGVFARMSAWLHAQFTLRLFNWVLCYDN